MYKIFLENAYSLVDSELKKFVENRKLKLEQDVYTEYEPYLKSVHHGYMSEKTTAEISEDSLLMYNLKDIDYLDYIKYMRNNNVNCNDLDNILVMTGEYVSNYFAYKPLEDHVDCRKKYIENAYKKKGLTDIFEMAECHDRPSINIFKGNGQGLCLEHSLLMQQLLSFIGVDTTIVVMYGYRYREYRVIGHVGNIIHFSNTKHLFYDLVHRSVILDEKGIKTAPNMVLISDDDYRKFIDEEGELSLICRNDMLDNNEEVTKYYLKSSSSLNKVEAKVRKKI